MDRKEIHRIRPWPVDVMRVDSAVSAGLSEACTPVRWRCDGTTGREGFAELERSPTVS
jgi:hypothetical protein